MRLNVRALALSIAAILLVSAACGDDDDGPASPDATTPRLSAGQKSGSPLPTPDFTIPAGLGEELSLQEYFTSIDGIFDTANVANTQAEADFTAGLASAQDLEGQVTVIQTFLEALINQFSDAIGAMGILTPPETAAAPHQEFLDAALDAATAASDLQNRLEDVDTDEEGDAITQEYNTTFTDIVKSADDACIALQAVADTNAIAVELTCQ